MAPTIILIRHAQALHIQNWQLHDPELTELGFGAQCDELAKHLQNDLPLAQEIELIVVSPMKRTLQTAQQSLGWLMKRGTPVILRAEWQENSDQPCDTGSSIEVMEKEWPQFDWSVVDPLFPAKSGLYEFSKAALIKRGITAKQWLKDRPEKVIAVVSHSAFLRTAVSNRKYANADYRIFTFTEDNTTLIESEITETRGGGMGKSPIGVFFMEAEDCIPEEEKDLGEATQELPK